MYSNPHSRLWILAVWLLAFYLAVGHGTGNHKRRQSSSRRSTRMTQIKQSSRFTPRSETQSVQQERLRNVQLLDPPSQMPKFFRYIEFSFIRDSVRPEPIRWEIFLDSDIVLALIYHRGKPDTPLLLIRQFRPTYFVNNIRQMAENEGKPLTQIDWTKYPVSIGETLELCGGMMDKPGMSEVQVVKEEIEEECGYSPPLDSIRTDIGNTGARSHIFFAEIDESMRFGKGGGLLDEGESITNVFISIDEAKDMVLGRKSADAPPSLLYALSWFLLERRP